ncbi:MAG TPA: CHAD domain-containing protein, partial [Candidatus Methylomirabilis sp.]|nr:CHAD domain-containing protein [Candidatus Methylomirabilis sp.]
MEAATNVGWFGLPARTSLSRLLRALDRAGYLAGPFASLRYECVFVEAQDGRLAKAGCRLAVQRAGKTLTWQLSGPEGASEAPFEGDSSFRSVSSDAVGISTVSTLVPGRRLLFPLVRVRVSSQEARLKSPAGDGLVLRVERFIAAPPGGDGSKQTQPQGILTVRFLGGNSNAFLHLATYLRDRLNLPASSGDVCSMALQTLELPEPGASLPPHLRISSKDPLALAARKVVGQQALKMRANVQGTLEDLDPEYLHDLRVAARRLRSALRLFAEVLGPARCASLRVELGWISHFLGAVRDLDVFIPNLQVQTLRLGEAGVVAGLLAEELERQRAPAREILEKALVSPRFSSLMRRLEALASSPPPRHPRGAQGVPVSGAAPALIWKAQRRVLRLGRSLGPE